MEEKYINKILNFSDENICTAKELVINREQAKKIVKELQEDYTPNAIIKLKIAEQKKEYKKLEQTSDFIIADTIQPKIQILKELLEEEQIWNLYYGLYLVFLQELY